MDISISGSGRGKRSSLTEPLITEWILFYKEKTGDWPTAKSNDQTVWTKDSKKDSKSAWSVVQGEAWMPIHRAIHQRLRGLVLEKEIKSLHDLVEKVKRDNPTPDKPSGKQALAGRHTDRSYKIGE
jgi:hypothetical protein